MREAIKDEYTQQYLLGRGGLSQMTQADWGSIGGMVADQYRYLGGFAREVAVGNLSEAQVAARSRMYINSGREAFERARGRTEDEADEVAWTLNPAEHCPDCLDLAALGWQPREPWPFTVAGGMAIPGSGATQCLTNCRCFLDYRVSEEVPETALIGGKLPDNGNDLIDMLNDWLVEGTGYTSWQEVPLSERASVKLDLVRALARQSGVPAEDVNRLIVQWTYPNYGDDMRHLAIQQDAAELFGIPLSERHKKQLNILLETFREWKPDPVWGEDEPPEKLLPLFSSTMQQSVLQSIYDYTQESLAAAGIRRGDAIRLFRGIRLPEAIAESWQVGDAVPVTGNALESWSLGEGIGRFFARDPEEGFVGIVIEMAVPRTMIFSTSRTGFGCLKEGEFVVLGSMPGKARVVQVYGD